MTTEVEVFPEWDDGEPIELREAVSPLERLRKRNPRMAAYVELRLSPEGRRLTAKAMAEELGASWYAINRWANDREVQACLSIASANSPLRQEFESMELEALDILRRVMHTADKDAVRVSAAKELAASVGRLMPGRDREANALSGAQVAQWFEQQLDQLSEDEKKKWAEDLRSLANSFDGDSG